MLSVKPYRGSRDFYPPEMRFRKWMFSRLRSSVEQFGFEEMDAPILEPIDLYLAKTSEEIVSTQIYTFKDRGDRQMVIRPEMTPSVSRMVAGKFRDLKKPIRWYSIPNLWRYERPSKGRLREHWQLNCDIFGAPDPFWADLEILHLAVTLLKNFGADHTMFRVKMNDRRIINYLFENVLKIQADWWAPVARIMDKKEKIPRDEYMAMMTAAGLGDAQIASVDLYLENPARFFADHRDGSPVFAEMEKLMAVAAESGLRDYVEYDPSVVRGFDYYTGFVFEIFDLTPGNNRSLFGGGRYDRLLENFGIQSANAVGFGMGDVTLQDFLESHHLVQNPDKLVHVYLAVFPDPSLLPHALNIASDLRKAGLNVEMNLGQKKMGKQFQEADEKNIPLVIILGEEEIKNNSVQMKNMKNGTQNQVFLENLQESIQSEWEKIYAAKN